MGSRSTKYGGVEKFMVGLITKNKDMTFHLVYNEYPKSQKYVQDILNLGATIHVINVYGINIITNLPKFYKLLKHTHPTIVHFHFSSVHALWAPLCHFLGVKKIFHTSHSCIFQKGKNVNNINEMGLSHRLLTMWGRSFKLFDYNLCVSKYVMQQFVKVYGNHGNNRVIYLGTDNPPTPTYKNKEEFKKILGISNTSMVLLSVLFADSIKGCDILIKSLSKIKGDFHLIIIGMEESKLYTRQMHNLAKGLGVEERISWIGITNNVHDYMNISDLYIQPSRTEALSLAAVEAMSHALPVIASNVGGLPEVASHLFKYEDDKGLANILSELINNKEESQRVGTILYKKWKETFSITNGINQYTYLYNI